MLDCCIDLKPSMKFLPLSSTTNKNNIKARTFLLKNELGNIVKESELKECAGKVFINSLPEYGMPEKDLIDLSSVDIILISNYQNLLALPYITEYSGFHGNIYTTEPNHHIGRLFMLELVNNFSKSMSNSVAVKWKKSKKLPKSLQDCSRIDSWKQYFNLSDVKNSLSKVKVIGYEEKFSIFGTVNAVAYSSGYALGSCNWVLESSHEKIVYMGGSSILTTHPEPLNTAGMRNADVLLFNGLAEMNGHNPDSMLSEFCTCLASTIKGNGNVLIPCYPSGLVYDLLECLLTFLKQSGLNSIPIYFVSSVAKDSLAFSQIYAEWLHPNKKNKVFLPEPPFLHGELIEENRLKLFPSVHEGKWLNFKNPCIVFAGHPTLRCGDAVHFVELWGSSSANSIIFVEPHINYIDALSPFQPLQMKSYYFPIDTRSDCSTSAKIINELEPKLVIVPTSYTKPPVLLPHRHDMVLKLKCSMQCIKANTVLTVDLKKKFQRVQLNPIMTKSILPTTIKPGVFLSSLSGSLTNLNNEFVLAAAERQIPKARKRRFHDGPTTQTPIHRKILWGKPEISNVLQTLKNEGFTDAKVETTADGHMILFQDIIILLENNSTHIVCEENEKIRVRLKDILLQTLSSL